MNTSRAESIARAIQASHDEFCEIEQQFRPLVAETQAAIGGVAKALFKTLDKLPEGETQPIYVGRGSSLGPRERIVTPPCREKPVAGFRTLTAQNITVATWHWQRIRRKPALVQLNFDDLVQQHRREDPELAGHTGHHASIDGEGVALFDFSSAHTEMVSLRFDSTDEIRQAYPRVNCNALGVASLVAAGVIAAYDLDPEALPLQPLDALFQDWEAEMGIVDISEPFSHIRPIQSRTTIPHLERLRERESLLRI